jgi:hypothetical protein
MALTLQQIRENNPRYNRLDDDQLANYLHKRYYSDLPFKDFSAAIGYEDPNADGDIARGFKNTFRQLPELGYGLLAAGGATLENAVGEGGIATGIKNSGLEGYREAAANVEENTKPSDSLTYSWNKAKEGDFNALADWLQYGLGYAGGQGLQMLATGMLGGAAAKMAAPQLAQALTEKMVASEAAKIAATEGAKTLTQDAIRAAAVANVASKIGQIGATAATGTAAFGMEGGEIGGEMVVKADQEGRKLTGGELAQGFKATLVAGGLEFVGDMLGLGALTGKIKIPGPTGMLARGLATGAALAPPEAATEYGQTLLEEWGKGNDPFSEESRTQAVDAAGLGAVGGGAMGFAGGVISGSPQDQKKQTENPLDSARGIAQATNVDEAINAMDQALSEPVADSSKPHPRTQYDDSFHAAAQQYGVPVDVLKALAMQESGMRQFDANGNPVKPESSNALGIMQIIPKWHPEFDAERLASDPDYNIKAGAQFLGELIKRNGGDVHKALQGYYGSQDATANQRYADSVLARMGGKNSEAGNGELVGEKEQARISESNQKIAPPEDVLPGAIRTQGLETQEAAGSGNAEVLQGGDQFANSAGMSEASTSNEMPAHDDQASASSIPDVFVATHELSDGTPVIQLEGNLYRDAEGSEYQDDYAELIQPTAHSVRGNDRFESDGPVRPVDRNDSSVFEPQQEPVSFGLSDRDNGRGSLTPTPSEIDQAAHEAATSPLNDLPQPTPAQKEAGNYKKAHVKLHGLDITIENPQGSKRSGVDADGKPWSIDMAHHYGYIKRSTGADNEHVDVFVGNKPESTKAFVVNQVDPKTGDFDEHKILLGFDNKTQARQGYLKNYAKGWKGLGSITEIPISELKAKIESGAIRKPIRNATTETSTPEEQGLSKGTVGGMVSPKQVLITSSGRQTTPHPGSKIIKKAEKWLLENAALEAEARGDDFNARAFRAELGAKSIPQTSKDAAEEYLFGQQPEVQKPFLKPLNTQETNDKSTNQAAQKAEEEVNVYGVRNQPRLAESGDSLYRKAKEISKTGVVAKGGRIIFPVINDVSGGKRFQFNRDGKLERLNATGMAAVQATKSEIDEINDAFDKDQLQIELPMPWGQVAGKRAGKPIQILHSPRGMSFRDAPIEQAINESTQTNNPIPAIQPNEQNPDPDPAQPVAPAAQENLAGKAAQPVAKKKAIVNDSDDLLAAIAKLGGLSRDEAKAQGIDPASFSHRGSGIKRVFTKADRSYDEMAELLRGYNFDAPMANDLVDKVSRSINQGEKFYNPAGSERAAELMAQERFSDEQARLALELEQRIDDEEIDESAIDFLLEQYDDNIDMGREMSAEEIEAFWGAIDEQADKTTGGGRTEVSQADEVLQGYTESDLAGRAGAEKQRLKQEESDRVKAEQKAKADRERDSVFDEMAGSAPKTEDVFGMTDPLEDINKKSDDIRFSKSEKPASDFARYILDKLNVETDFGRFPVSESKDIQTVFAEILPIAKYKGWNSTKLRHEFVLAGHEKANARFEEKAAARMPFYVYENDGDIWLDVSQLKTGSGGSAIYFAAGNYAYNTNQTFIGDPEGLSPDAVVRRTANMLALAIRFGTTRFMEPSIEQLNGDPEEGIAPLTWEGSDEQRVMSLIETFLENLHNHFPEIKNARYDFDQKQFIGPSGGSLDDEAFNGIRKSGFGKLAEKARVGSTTTRQGIFLQSLVSLPPGERSELLEKLLRWDSSLSDRGLGGLFSQDTKKKSGGTVADVKSWLPKRVKRLLDAGKLKIVQSVEDLPAYLQERGTALYHAAWHGSPHNHDRFDSSKIGTGEGAQAYGYGLYFADSKEIAEWYRDALKNFVALDGTKADPYKMVFSKSSLVTMFQNRMAAKLDETEARTQTAEWAKTQKQITEDLSPDQIDDFVSRLSFGKGRLYQVELAPEQDEYLLWDKPLSEQSEKVKTALKNSGMLDYTLPFSKRDQGNAPDMSMKGGEFYKEMSGGYDEDASNTLHKAGVRGIKYLDGTSRSGERENYNYVIFSDEDISITAKYSKLAGVEALYDEKRDQMYLVADMLDKDNLNQVLAHELLHRAEAVDPQVKAAISRFESQLDRSFKHAAAGRGGAIEKAAYRRVIDAETPAADQAAEYRAYLVSEYSRNPDSFAGLIKKAIQDFIAAIRAALIRSGLDMGFIRSLTPADLAAMSRLYGAKIQSSSNNNADSISPNSDNIIPNSDNIKFSRNAQNSNDTLQEFKRRAGLGPKKTLFQAMQDILDRGLDTNVQAIKDKWREVRPQLEQGIFDKFLGIKLAEREILGDVAHSVSGYIGARLSTGSSSTMSAVLQYGAPEWRDGIIQRKQYSQGFAEILKPVKDDLENFTAWMVARRADRLLQEGKENNFTREMIDAGLALKKDGYQQVADNIAELNSSILDLAEDAGLIDSESRVLWESSDYIPFYRLIEGKKTMGPHGKKGLSHQSSGIRLLKGGENPLSDPLGNMMQNWAHLIDAAMKNNALDKTLTNLEGSRFIDKVPRVQFRPALIPKEQIKQLMLESGLPEEIVDAMPETLTSGIAKMWAMQAPTDPDIVRVMRDGKSEYYRVNDSMLLTSLVAVNQAPLSGLFKPMRYMKSLLTSAVTADPTFMARNFIRDSMHSWTIAEEKGFKFGVDSIHGAIKSFHEEGGYIDMMFAGASFQGGYGNYNNPDASRQSMESVLRKRGISNPQGFMDSIIDTPKKYWEMYRSIGDAIENANREATLENAKRAGAEKAQYLFEAKDLMDFSMQGSFTLVRAMSDMLPFFNARLIGLYRLAKAGKTSEARQIILRKGATIAMMSLALMALNAGDDRYEELEDWDKDQYWHFFFGDQHFRIPKPFELGLIFGTVPERSARLLLGKDTLKEFAARMGHGASDTLAFNPVPQLFRPYLELYANKDMFTGRPIENMGDEGRLPSARYNAYTSETMRLLSEALPEALGASPKRLEHLVQGYTGAMGMYLLGAADVMVRSLSDMPGSPAMRIDRLPVVKAFYQEQPSMHTKYGTDFYEMLREVEQISKTINAYRKEGRMDDARELQRDNAGKLNARKSLTRTNKALSEIRHEVDAIYRSNLSPEQKRRRIDQLMTQTNRMMEKIVRKTHPYFS